MDKLIEYAMLFIQQNAIYATLAAFLIAFGESLFIIGFAIPATALMILLGGLIGSETIDAGPIVSSAILGAILGDAVSYWLGRKLGWQFVYKWPLNNYRNGIARTRLYFRKYGLASIFLGRFLGPIRSTIPLLAGMMMMNHFRFQIANVSSAIAWSLCMLAPGWIAGQSAAEFEGGTYLERAMIIAAISIVIVIVSGAVAKRIFLPSANEVRSRRVKVQGCCGGAHASCVHHH